MKNITVTAFIDRLQQVLAQIAGFLEQEGCPENERRLIEISAEELFTNIVSYAYGKYPGISRENGQVQVEYGVNLLPEGEKQADICFIDQGKPFNPFAREDPDLTLSLEERPVGGLGIYMVKQFMDQAEYRYEKGFNVTTISKRFRPEGERKSG